MWASNGEHIYFYSGGRAYIIAGGSTLPRVWRVSAKGGDIEPETILPGVGTLSRDGSRLAYEEVIGFSSAGMGITRVQLSEPGGQVVTQDTILVSPGGKSGMQPSPDGRQIVYESWSSGRPELWKSNADGSDPLQLTFLGDQGYLAYPRWSPDGKWIAFSDRSGAHIKIGMIDRDGRNLHAIASGNYDNVTPSWSTDGRTVYFSSNRTGSWEIWKSDLSTGKEDQVTHNGGFASAESHDGKALYYSKPESAGIWKIPVKGGQERLISAALHLGYWGHFAVTDTGIYLVDADQESPTIMFYSFESERLRPVFAFKGDQDPVPGAANLSASRDGRTLMFTQISIQNSIVVAEGFQ
jgi:dipeptidyl aminopeptidase/acylaminoacyl peptidase